MGFWSNFGKGALIGLKIGAGVALKASDSNLIKLRPEEHDGLEDLGDIVSRRLDKSFPGTQVPAIPGTTDQSTGTNQP